MKFGKLYSYPVYRFLINALGLLLLWYLVYTLWLHPAGWLDKSVVNSLTDTSGWLLQHLGFDIIPEPMEDIRIIGIDGTHGLWIGDPCNGLNIFALFAGFVIAYPGPWKKKWWFILLGIFILHAVNILRIIGLCLVLKYHPDALNFNHTYTFQIIVYGCVFALWYRWVTHLSGIKLRRHEAE